MHLLLVEASSEIAHPLVKLLQRAGFEVSWAATGAQAVSGAADQAFDAIICDLQLGDTSGASLMLKLQALRPCPAIALSDDFIPSQYDVLREAGFSTYARKPVDVDTLLLLIRQHVGAHLNQTVPYPAFFAVA